MKQEAIQVGKSGIKRRTVLRGLGAASVGGLIGLPSMSGAVLAEDLDPEICPMDIICAVDASGSLTSADAEQMQEGVNAFVDSLPTNDTVLVGSLEFAAGEVRKVNGLQNPNDLTVVVEDNPSGDTPMPAALDIADNILYNDDNQREDAEKLIVLFTDGGPNYEEQYVEDGLLTYSATLDGTDYVAPRDQSADWSAVAGNDVYDNADGGIANVSEGEMDETALVAGSIKSGVGDGETLIATVYVDVVGDDTNAMTQDAIDSYTDLPTYLEAHIASPDLAVEGDIENIESLAAELISILEEECQPVCVECEPGDLLAKYEFTCVETDPDTGDCINWDFELEDGGDGNISYSAGNYISKEGEDGEPMEVTFQTEYCNLCVLVKSGQELEVQCFEDIEGTVVVETANDEKYAISYVAFYCTEAEAQAAKESFPSNNGGRGRGRGS